MPPSRLPRSERTFIPPHCPYEECDHHFPRSRFRFHRKGSRQVQRRPGAIKRFRCCHCRRTFSSSRFRADCWKKKPPLLDEVFRRQNEGQSLRGIARALNLSLTSIRRRSRIIASQSVLRHLTALRRLFDRIDDITVMDGFRTFAGSQYEVVELQTTALARSGFGLTIDPFGLRRMGRMTDEQLKQRSLREKRDGRPDPRARRKATEAVLALLARLVKPGRPIHLVTDEELAYHDAVKASRYPIKHQRIPSTAIGDSAAAMWRTNHMHRMMRHFLKNVARETIAHSKTMAGLFDRAIAFLIWLNYTKGISERSARSSRITPAMLLGLADRPLDGNDLFGRRLFPAHVGLPAQWIERYLGTIKARPGDRVRPYRYKVAR